MPEGQRVDARYARSFGRVSWQPNPAEVAEDELVRMAHVGCSRQQVVPCVPREPRVNQSIHREVELVRCRGSVDCDGCSEAQGGAETRPHR